MVTRDIPLRAFNERIYSHAILKSKVQAIISNQIGYLKSYLVELLDKERFTQPILKSDTITNMKTHGNLIDESQRELNRASFSVGVFLHVLR